MASTGITLIGFAAWLTMGLLACSVNPELSTQANHIFGSVTHDLCSALINSIGLMSLSLSLLIARLGFVLWSARLPELNGKDLVVYTVFVALMASLLQLALDIELMGAPIGGLVGLTVSEWLTDLGPYLSQGLVCIAVFGIIAIQVKLSQPTSEEVSKAHPERWISEVHRGAQPVKSLSANQQRDHQHVFNDLDQLPPEFENESNRFEAVESFYDDLDGAPSRNEARRVQPMDSDLVFKFEEEQILGSEPRFTMENSQRSISQQQISSEGTPTFSGGPSHELSENDGAQAHSPRLTSINTPVNMSATRTPIERISQSLTPKISRETLLQRAFDSLQLTFALTSAHSGRAADRYVFASPVPPALPLYEIAEQLNAQIRRSLGRSEPPVLLTVSSGHEQYMIEVTWPRRTRVFTETADAMKVIRGLESRGELTVYLGETVDDQTALLPLAELKSLIVTGGETLEQERGIDIILTNLIYQAPPPKLRLLILDIASERSPYAQLPHLYSPIINDTEKMTEVLRWIPIEHRRRRSVMGRAGVSRYDDYMSGQGNAEPRLVLLVPELSLLDNEQQSLLLSAIEKLGQSECDTGIHLILNTRVFGERSAKFVRHVDAHIALPVRSLEAARGFGITGAEWLLPENDFLLRLGPNHIQRIHSWTLAQASYSKILKVLSRSTERTYINANQEFLSVTHLKSGADSRSTDRSRSRSKTNHPQRLSESSLPPI